MPFKSFITHWLLLGQETEQEGQPEMGISESEVEKCCWSLRLENQNQEWESWHSQRRVEVAHRTIECI